MRARLSDIVAQTRPDDGIQPHRSWWVARGTVAGLDRESGKPVLRLTDGDAVPVARGRLPEVRDWIDTHLG
ncbi:DNA-binding protein, LytTr [Salipiger abyssi]|uniref:DNA-binding protein, LytTr n=2 Tax=Salipiger abyssi TaxID=1250539 RepID=A0A1P8UY28_9RHOB|nr:DNA-binding protein, LytTr [Salipiger abyssi]